MYFETSQSGFWKFEVWHIKLRNSIFELGIFWILNFEVLFLWIKIFLEFEVWNYQSSICECRMFEHWILIFGFWNLCNLKFDIFIPQRVQSYLNFEFWICQVWNLNFRLWFSNIQFCSWIFKVRMLNLEYRYLEFSILDFKMLFVRNVKVRILN